MDLSLFGTPIVPLLQTVFTAILEVFLLCLAGYILAGRGILDKKTQKQLNRLNVSLFTPSLLFSKVAFFLSPEKLRELWIIPIFFVLVTLISTSVSFLLGWAFRLRRSQRNFAMAASMFMNSNSLPIALMQSLVVTVPGLKWGEDDNKNAMLGRALSYLVVYSTLGMILRWSYGVRLLATPDIEPIAQAPNVSHETNPLLQLPESEFDQPSGERRTSSYESATVIEEDRESSISGEEDGHTIVEASRAAHLRPSHPPAHFYYSFPNSPNGSQRRFHAGPTISLSDTEESSDDELPPAFPVLRRRHRNQITPTSTRFQSFLRRSRHRVFSSWSALNHFMTVPLWAALASLLVACIRPLQHALDFHMQAVKSALNAAGNCSIPVTLIVLGAYFYPPPIDPSSRIDRPPSVITTRPSSSSLMLSVKNLLLNARQRGETRVDEVERPGETKTVVIAVLSRMVITPLLMLPMMALSTKFSLQPVLDDPVFVLANVLLISSPPALTLAQITQAASGDAFERLISRTVFWSYCVVTPPAIIINVVIGLLLTKLREAPG